MACCSSKRVNQLVTQKQRFFCVYSIWGDEQSQDSERADRRADLVFAQILMNWYLIHIRSRIIPWCGITQSRIPHKISSLPYLSRLKFRKPSRPAKDTDGTGRDCETGSRRKGMRDGNTDINSVATLLQQNIYYISLPKFWSMSCELWDVATIHSRLVINSL